MAKGSAEYTTTWLDQHTPWGVVAATLRITDTAEDVLYDAIADAAAAHPVAVEAWRMMFEWNVRRAVSAAFFTDALPPRVRVSVSLAAVGSKSYTMRFDVSAADTGRPVAWVDVVSVSVDAATQTRALPVPHRDILASYARRTGGTLGPVSRPPGSPRGAFETTVRRTDCDRNGHVNNSLYPLLAMEALPSPTPAVGRMEVVYTAPLRPGQMLAVDCVTCEEDGADTFWCEITTHGTPAARVWLRPLAAKYRAGPRRSRM